MNASHRKSIFLLSLFWFCGCTSSGPTNSVLEPINEEEAQAEPVRAPSYPRIMELLQSLGYSGIGLEYEVEETLSFLVKVFEDPRTHERKLRLVYTGLAMSFDPQQSSLTVGGVAEVGLAVEYIMRNVPPLVEPPVQAAPPEKISKPKPLPKKKK